ncbi:AraC family transcriptional regulator [Paenibacillus filicis]|uniref:AraC family transcriptional regulator n=1 Tax=Paenibacillus gyeongsangnamensis TaxID=3388067 RepID=A0ABT4QJB5_9BACL|nr:AraC family transcriptional regulator [Paenibacillus filicis]MCZ8516877.1 AraC family transcriptional regulator [Paenibacillus filicis]
MMVQPFQITNISLTIFHLTDINTVILNNNGSIQLLHERDPLPEFMQEVQQKDFLLLGTEAKRSPEQICMFTNEWGLSYLAKLLQMKGEEPKILVNGPFLIQVPDITKFEAKIKIDQQKRIELEAFYQGLKLIGRSKIQSISNILDRAVSIRQASLQILEINPNSPDSSQKMDVELMLKQSDDSYIEVIALRYKIEKEMMRAIEQGDKAKLKQTITKVKNLFDFSERFPNQPVRAMRNSIIILNTLFRIAAENGRVQPVFLHQISEKFSKQIERSETIHSLNKLISVMCDEYCDLVRHRAISGYSPIVQKAAEYIMAHFSRPLHLGQLSEYCHVHPAHLSRQFKKETGITLTDYQQKRRIEEAKVLLKTDRASIGWIAGYVGFDDAGYFTRIFKRLEGVSPSEYRNSKAN